MTKLLISRVGTHSNDGVLMKERGGRLEAQRHAERKREMPRVSRS